MKVVTTVLIFLTILAVLLPVAAQDDILTTEYNQLTSITFNDEGEQAFIQFTGVEGDVVYLQADFTDFVIGPELTLDLRDSVGRSIGFSEEHSFQPFVIAQLPADGMYTAVVTYRDSNAESNEVEILVGLSDKLSSEPATVTIDTESFPALFLVEVDQTGQYRVELDRTDGSMATDFQIVNYSEFFTQPVISVGGSNTSGWAAYVELDANNRYIAFLDSYIFRDSGSDATVSITLTPED